MTINYGQAYFMTPDDALLDLDDPLSDDTDDRSAKSRDYQVKSGAILFYLNWWKKLLKCNDSEIKAFYKSAHQNDSWLETLLLKHNKTHMIHLQHVK